MFYYIRCRQIVLEDLKEPKKVEQHCFKVLLLNIPTEKVFIVFYPFWLLKKYFKYEKDLI